MIIAFGVKAIVDYFALRSGARLFLQRVPIFHFLIAELLHVPYIVIAAAIGQLSSIQWKGRKIRTMRLDIQILKIFFPSILFNTTDESIHLTFDDGPHPIATPLILQELRKRNIQATFFLLGSKCAEIS